MQQSIIEQLRAKYGPEKAREMAGLMLYGFTCGTAVGVITHGMQAEPTEEMILQVFKLVLHEPAPGNISIDTILAKYTN